ncbi:MAG: beta-ketoacyl-[acyl-carrier-protein] synthase family protein [Myxococcota bacterium]|nr:beta-ketoacyl-[acyl-carrier-protein] synthase family protein [Myxococcota bacterium]
MNKHRVAVTGLGAVSAAGFGVGALAQGLKQAERVFQPDRTLDLDFEVTLGQADEACFAAHDYPALDSPTGRLCLSAARECAKNVQWQPDGLSLGTSTGGQSVNEKALFSLLDGAPLPHFSYPKQGCMAAPTRLVARDLDISGPVQTVSTACTSSAVAIALGASWIAQGRACRVLAGGGDALCYTTVAGFHIMQLTGPEMCRPFGPDRPGMTLGEGAGFLALEPLDQVESEDRHMLAELIGWGLSSDAHHMTAPPEDGSGAEQAIRRALEMAHSNPSDVCHVNAHGTGTVLNDAAEAAAICRVFGADVPVMSCKGLTGHTLGGAGAIEAVATVLAIAERRAFENLGASHPAADCPVSLVPPGGLDLPDVPVIVSTSFAFGGNNCALVFRAP